MLSEGRIADINICAAYAPCQEHEVDVAHVSVRVGDTPLFVVLLALGIEVVLSVGDDLTSLGIESQFSPNQNAGVVEVVPLDSVDGSVFVD